MRYIMKRFSILTNDLSRCYVCGRPKNAIHDVYFGKNRNNSIKYGCCVPLCIDHHTGYNGVHHNSNLDNELKKKCQKEFEKIYLISFLDIFHKNYI